MKSPFRFIVLLASLGSMFIASASARAAEFELRPDLYDHIAALRMVYPHQSPASVTGARPPVIADWYGGKRDGSVWFDEGAGEGSVSIIRISGIIEKGDAEKLKQFLDEAVESYARQRMIVFNSPGGNFLEAFKIAQLIRSNLESQDPNICCVFVLEGEECLSACALAFALSVDMVHTGALDGRFVEDGARLGFHMALLPASATTSVAQYTEVLNFTYDVIAEYSKLVASGLNPPELMIAALKHRTSDSFFYLDGGIDTWNLGFSPVSRKALAASITASGPAEWTADDICNTVVIAGKMFKSVNEISEFSFFQSSAFSLPELGSIDTAVTLVADSFSCQVSLGDDRELRIAAWRGDPQCVGPLQSNEAGGLPQHWCTSTKVVSDRVTVGLLGDALVCNRGQLGSRSQWGGEDTPDLKGSALGDVTVRQAPSTESRALGKLQEREDVIITDCTAKADSQGIWYRVESAGKPGGWVSARYIAPFTSMEGGYALPITPRVTASYDTQQ